MKFLKTKALNILFLKILFFYSRIVFAAEGEAPFKTYEDIISFLEGLTNILATIFWIIAVGAAVYSGYLFIFEGASEQKVGKAKKMLLYTVIAIIIGLMAYGLPSLIQNILETVRS